MTRLALALPLLLAPALASALEVAPGRYSAHAEHCDTLGYDGIVTVGPGELRFYESGCTLANERPVRGMEGAVLYDAQCGGEGETWSRRMLLVPLLNGGLGIAQEGSVAAYFRCGE